MRRLGLRFGGEDGEWRSEVCLHAFVGLLSSLAGLVDSFSLVASWNWGLGKRDALGKIKVEGENLYDPPELGKGSRGGSMRWSARERGMRLGGQIWRTGGRGEDLQLAYLFSWPEWLLGFQGISVGVVDWGKAMSGRWWWWFGGGDLYDPLDVGVVMSFECAYMCIYLGLISYNWITYQGAWSWRRLNLSQQPLIACSLYLWVGSCKISPIHFGMSSGNVLLALFRHS